MKVLKVLLSFVFVGFVTLVLVGCGSSLEGSTYKFESVTVGWAENVSDEKKEETRKSFSGLEDDAFFQSYSESMTNQYKEYELQFVFLSDTEGSQKLTYNGKVEEKKFTYTVKSNTVEVAFENGEDTATLTIDGNKLKFNSALDQEKTVMQYLVLVK